MTADDFKHGSARKTLVRLRYTAWWAFWGLLPAVVAIRIQSVGMAVAVEDVTTAAILMVVLNQSVNQVDIWSCCLTRLQTLAAMAYILAHHDEVPGEDVARRTWFAKFYNERFPGQRSRPAASVLASLAFIVVRVACFCVALGYGRMLWGDQ